MAIMLRPTHRASEETISSALQKVSVTRWSTSPRTWLIHQSIRSCSGCFEGVIMCSHMSYVSYVEWFESAWCLEFFFLHSDSFLLINGNGRRLSKDLATQGKRTLMVVCAHWAESTMVLAVMITAAQKCPRDGLPTSSILFGSSVPYLQQHQYVLCVHAANLQINLDEVLFQNHEMGVMSQATFSLWQTVGLPGVRFAIFLASPCASSPWTSTCTGIVPWWKTTRRLMSGKWMS